MAAGDGFKQVPFGFDKNEVNTYISDLRKKMNALEADMRSNDEKTRAAEKLAEEADGRIKAAQEEADKKVEEISALLEEEKSTTSRQMIEIRNLKERLDNEKKKMTDMLKNGKGVSQEATRAFNEVIDKANEEASDIIENAEKQAQKIIDDAKQHSSDISEKTDAFLAMLREQIGSMNDGFNTLNQSAAELLGTEAAPAVSLPEPEPVAAPAPVFTKPEEPAEVPDMSVFDSVTEEEQPEEELAPAEEAQPEPGYEPKPEAAEPEESEEEVQPEEKEGDAPAMFDDEWSGNEMADAVAAAEKQMAQTAEKNIPLVNPDATSPFGGDLFNADDHHDDMSGFEMDNEEPSEEAVDEISPLDVSDHAEASYDNNFNKDLLAQTMPSNSLGSDADDDLLAAVRAAEEAAAVKPSNVSDFDMDEEPEQTSGASEEDDLMKALREAEAAFGGGSADESPDEPEEEEAAAEDPWAALQKQLEAMESANGGASSVTYDEPEQPDEPEAAQPEPEADPDVAPPSADDSSIWNFGTNSTDDDDMSSDFGGFGGF